MFVILLSFDLSSLVRHDPGICVQKFFFGPYLPVGMGFCGVLPSEVDHGTVPFGRGWVSCLSEVFAIRNCFWDRTSLSQISGDLEKLYMGPYLLG